MKKVHCSHFLILLPLLCLTGCSPVNNVFPPDETQAVSRPITVLTYNIRIGAGRQKFGRNPSKLKDEITLDLAPVIEAIRSVSPDIVGLQEVLGEKQAAEIAMALHMNYAYIPHGTERYGIWWGVALLSKFPLQTAYPYEISYGRGNTRSLLVAEIKLFDKRTTFICIHKDKDQTDGNALRKTMRKINAIKTPVVLLGDLNIRPDDERHDILSGRLQDTALLATTQSAQSARQRGTYPGKNNTIWGKRIDYILVDKGLFHVLDAGIFAKQHWNASDHLGYYTILQSQQ